MSIYPDEVLLTLEVAATSLPVGRDQLKRDRRIIHDDDDIMMDASIRAACAFAESMSGFAILTQTWKISLRCAPFERLYFPKYPVTGIVSIDYYDTDNVAQSAVVDDYTLYDSGVDNWLEPIDGAVWPATKSRPDGLSVTFSVGGGLMKNEELRRAVIMIAADWYDQKDESGSVSNLEAPFGAMSLINLNRRSWIAA